MFITLGTHLQIYWSVKFVTIIWYIQRNNISYRIYYKKVTYLSYKPLSWHCFTLCQLDFGPQFLKLPKVKTFLKNYPVFWTLENSLQPDWMTLWNFFYNSIFWKQGKVSDASFMLFSVKDESYTFFVRTS